MEDCLSCRSCQALDTIPFSKSSQLENLLRLIADDPELRGIELHAPEGIEVRLLHQESVELMRRAGFE